MGIAIVLGATQARWQRAAPMPLPRTEVAAAPFRGGIAVIGGFAGGRVDVEAGRPLPAGTAQVAAPARSPRRRHHAMAASAGGKLYVVGGISLGAADLAKDALVLDLATGDWSTVPGPTDLVTKRWLRLPNLPTPWQGLGVVAIKSRVYAIAGGTSPGLTVSGANEILDLAR